ncbi:MAG: hypothetical protein LBG25_06560, partial [Spirochaetaceae bacterium]|nr:hypothetical protein [Spirochaetaceae bacterium]
PPLAASLILANYTAEDFRKRLGVNLFEDTVWFNKEAFEEALFYVPLFLALEGEAALEEVRRPRPAGKKAGPAGKGKESVRKAPGKAESWWLTRLEGIAKVADQFDRAEKESGYNLERLIELLSEGGGRPKPAPREGAGKKSIPKKNAKKS